MLPLFVESTYALHMMILIFISVITGSSWNILGGYTGQYSVGHAAYFGVGAYTTMILLQFRHVAPWYGIWAGAAAALVTALIIGSICFRLRGPYFVLASIAVAEIFRVSALNLKDITNGAEGILVTEIPPLTVGGRGSSRTGPRRCRSITSGLVFALVIILVSWLVRRSKLGYYFQAIREDQDAAHSLGINPDSLQEHRAGDLGDLHLARRQPVRRLRRLHRPEHRPRARSLGADRDDRHHRRHRHDLRPGGRRGGARAAVRGAAQQRHHGRADQGRTRQPGFARSARF